MAKRKKSGRGKRTGMPLWRVMHRGMDAAPKVGITGKFKGGMFIETHADWAKTVLNTRGQSRTDITSNQSCDKGICFTQHFVHKDGFVYLCAVATDGDVKPVAFTHDVIATNGGRVLSLC